MSYGYIIASRIPANDLEKNRRYRFYKIHSQAGINYYLRWEEGSTLAVRQGNTSYLTKEGAAFFNSRGDSFLLMNFLMGRKEGDKDILKRMQDAIKSGDVANISLAPGACIEINKVYRVR